VGAFTLSLSIILSPSSLSFLSLFLSHSPLYLREYVGECESEGGECVCVCEIKTERDRKRERARER